MHRRTYLFLFVGILAASALGITTDQILQNVYDSSNTALRANVVAGSIPGGGNTPTPMPTATPLTFGTSGVIPVFGATEFGSYAGATCASGFVTVVSAAGAVTCATPVPGAGQATPTVVPTATPQPTATPPSPIYRQTLSSASGATNLNNTGASNTGGFGFSALGASESLREMPIAIAVTAKNLYCYWSVAPASGKTWTATLRSGTCAGTMSDSTVTCTLTGNGSLQTCSDTTHSLAVSANQCATVSIVASGTPTATNAVCNYEIDP